MGQSQQSGRRERAIATAGQARLFLCWEWAFWVALAAVGFWLTFDFDEPLDIYRFGASGWPRFLLACIVVGASLQAIFGLLRLRRAAGIPAAQRATGGGEAAGPAQNGAVEAEGLGFSPMLLGIFTLPLLYLFLLPRTGFFVTTPFFVVAFLWILQVRRARQLIGVTTIAYALVLLIFVRLFYVALPVGNWPVFYDVNNWIVVAVRGLFGGA